jgi:hypothetical protein
MPTPRHSAFYGTPLEFLMEELGSQTLILGASRLTPLLRRPRTTPISIKSNYGCRVIAWLRKNANSRGLRLLSPPAHDASIDCTECAAQREGKAAAPHAIELVNSRD